jgi:hypothetical protein
VVIAVITFPCTPEGDVTDDVMYRSAATTIVKVTVPVTGTGEESVAVTVTTYDPPVLAAGVPEITPALLSVRPAGSKPEVRAYR